MHGSDRSGVNKAALGVWFAVAMLIAICGVILAHTEQSRHSKTASDHAEQYRRDADNRIRQTCISLAGQAKADCVSVAQEAASEGQRKEYDLYSQRSMAIWTIVMGYAAIFGVCLSGIGVYLIWTTFEATRRAADASTETLRAMKRFESPVMAVSFAKAPHVVIENDIKHVVFTIKVSNFGRTSAVFQSVKLHKESVRDYNAIIISNSGTTLSEEFRFPVEGVMILKGYVQYDTPTDFGVRAVFLVSLIDDKERFNIERSQIHPGGIWERDEEGYDDLPEF